MRLKTFTARTMQEAMAEVRAVLGPDAIIVASRGGENGAAVRITAAIEDPDPAGAVEHFGRARAEAPPPSRESVRDILTRHRISDGLAQSLTRATAMVEAEDPALTIAAALDNLLRFSVIEDQPRRPLLFLGLPGAGKTAAIAKLAAQAVLAEKKVALLTMDCQGAGALEQITAYARLLDLGVTAAPDAAGLASAIAQPELQAHDLILIDMPGLNPYDPAEVQSVEALLATVDVEPVAVLAAGGDGEEAGDLSLLLADLGCRRFIATKLDMVRRYGSLLTFAHAGPLAFAGVSASPFIGDPVDLINPVSLARILAAEPKAMMDAAERAGGGSPDQRRTVVTS